MKLLPFNEIASVFMRLDHVASGIAKRESQHHVNGCDASRRLRFSFPVYRHGNWKRKQRQGNRLGNEQETKDVFPL